MPRCQAGFGAIHAVIKKVSSFSSGHQSVKDE